jgi:hypothetical protein
MYRTIEWRYPRGVQPGVSTFARALGFPFFKILVKHEGTDGLPTLVGARECRGEQPCLIAAALRQTRDDLVLTSFNGTIEMRPIAELVATRTASNHEKALYLWALLKAAGVDVRLAASARKNSARIHESFPSSAPFNHTLVLAPGGLWLDPSCEHCDVGTLPDWSRDTRALPLSVRSSDFGEELWSDGFVDVKGAVATAGHRTRRYEVTVKDSGDVDVIVDEEAVGGDATDVHLDTHTWTKADAEQASLEFAKARSQAGRSLDATPWTCDRARGVCTWRHVYRLPGWATLDTKSGHWLVPLELLRVTREEWLAKKERRLPIVILEDMGVTEILRLTPPPGFTFDPSGVPRGEDSAAGYSSSVTVENEGGAAVIIRSDRLKAGRHASTHWAALHEASATFRGARTSSIHAVPSSPPSSSPPSSSSSSSSSSPPAR